MLRRAWMALGTCLTLLAVAGLLSACGSSSSSSSASTEEAATTEEPANTEEAASTEGEGSGSASKEEGEPATGKPVKIGLITGLTGPFAANLGQVGNVGKVWEEAVNNAGGIDGAPVEVIVKDDSGDPSKALVVARELVSEGVVAVAGSWDVTAAAYHPYLAEKGIPEIGGSPNSFEVENEEGFFPSGGNDAGLIYGIVNNAKEAGAKKLAVFYCAEYPNCTALANSTKVMAKEMGGIEIATTVAISATAPNYTAQCIQAKQTGADSMYVNDAGPTLPKSVSDCQQQGFNVPQFNNVNDTNGEFFSNPVAEGMVLSMPNIAASDTSTQGGKYFNEMLEKYAPGIKEEKNWNEAMVTTWAGLQLFRHAAELGNVNASSSPEDVFNGLYQIKEYTIEGMAPPLTFTKGKGTVVNCWFTGEIKGGEVVAESTEPQCIPDEQAPAILKTFEEG